MNLRCAVKGTVDGGTGEIKAREANFGMGAQTNEVTTSTQTLAGESGAGRRSMLGRETWP